MWTSKDSSGEEEAKASTQLPLDSTHSRLFGIPPDGELHEDASSLTSASFVPCKESDQRRCTCTLARYTSTGKSAKEFWLEKKNIFLNLVNRRIFIPLGLYDSDPKLRKPVEAMAFSTLYILFKCVISFITELVRGWLPMAISEGLIGFLIPLTGFFAIRWRHAHLVLAFLTLNCAGFLVVFSLWLVTLVKIIQRATGKESGFNFYEYRVGHFNGMTYFMFTATTLLVVSLAVNCFKSYQFRQRIFETHYEKEAENRQRIARLHEDNERLQEVLLETRRQNIQFVENNAPQVPALRPLVRRATLGVDSPYCLLSRTVEAHNENTQHPIESGRNFSFQEKSLPPAWTACHRLLQFRTRCVSEESGAHRVPGSGKKNLQTSDGPQPLHMDRRLHSSSSGPSTVRPRSRPSSSAHTQSLAEKKPSRIRVFLLPLGPQFKGFRP